MFNQKGKQSAIRKLEEHIGVEVQGVDITRSINAETFQKLREALYTHAVLIFHNQDITDQQHVAFSEGFGPLEMTMVNDPTGGGGSINILKILGYCLLKPIRYGIPMVRSSETLCEGSLLATKVIPPEGGETKFASLCAAYENLPEEKKVELEGLVAEHSLANS